MEAKKSCLAVSILTEMVNLTTAYIKAADSIMLNTKYEIPTNVLKYNANVMIISKKVKNTT